MCLAAAALGGDLKLLPGHRGVGHHESRLQGGALHLWIVDAQACSIAAAPSRRPAPRRRNRHHPPRGLKLDRLGVVLSGGLRFFSSSRFFFAWLRAWLAAWI